MRPGLPHAAAVAALVAAGAGAGVAGCGGSGAGRAAAADAGAGATAGVAARGSGAYAAASSSKDGAAWSAARATYTREVARRGGALQDAVTTLADDRARGRSGAAAWRAADAQRVALGVARSEPVGAGLVALAPDAGGDAGAGGGAGAAGDAGGAGEALGRLERDAADLKRTLVVRTPGRAELADRPRVVLEAALAEVAAGDLGAVRPAVVAARTAVAPLLPLAGDAAAARVRGRLAHVWTSADVPRSGGVRGSSARGLAARLGAALDALVALRDDLLRGTAG